MTDLSIYRSPERSNMSEDSESQEEENIRSKHRAWESIARVGTSWTRRDERVTAE